MGCGERQQGPIVPRPVAKGRRVPTVFEGDLGVEGRRMRTVTYGAACSLDGFIAGSDGAIDWLHFSRDVEAVMAQYWSSVDAVLMGRKTWGTPQKPGPCHASAVRPSPRLRAATPWRRVRNTRARPPRIYGLAGHRLAVSHAVKGNECGVLRPMLADHAEVFRRREPAESPKGPNQVRLIVVTSLRGSCERVKQAVRR